MIIMSSLLFAEIYIWVLCLKSCNGFDIIFNDFEYFILFALSEFNGMGGKKRERRGKLIWATRDRVCEAFFTVDDAMNGFEC